MEAKKNCMGTITFEYKFSGMKKAQEFDVYPIDKKSTDKVITIQSSTRIGKINLENGNVSLSKPHSNGAYFHHLAMDTLSESVLLAEDLKILRDAIIGTSSGEFVGSNGIVFCDNSNAAKI